MMKRLFGLAAALVLLPTLALAQPAVGTAVSTDNSAKAASTAWTRIYADAVAAARVIISDGTGATLGAQAAVDAAATSGASVEIRGNVQTLGTSLKMRAGVVVRCTMGGGLQATGTIVEFSSFTANRAELRDCILDGGWNGTSSADVSLAVQNYYAADTKIVGNKFRNIRGNAVYQNSTVRWLVEGNSFDDVGNVGVAVNNASPFKNYGTIRGNVFSSHRSHAVLTVAASEIVVERNEILYAPACDANVNLSGAAATTTVTWVSGTDFTNARVGHYIVTNAGLEYVVTAKASNTSLTASLSSGAYPGASVSNVPACIGLPDQINMQSGYGLTIRNNIVRGGVTAGILVWDDGTNPLDTATIAGNRVENAGSCGICITGLGASRRVSIADNLVKNAGSGGAATASGWNVGIYAQGAPTSVAITGNTMIDDRGTPRMLYGIALDGMAVGQAAVSGNTTIGAVNNGIRSGIHHLDLTGGRWGSTATASVTAALERSWEVSITPSGSGIAGDPAFYVYYTATPAGGAPISTVVAMDTTTGLGYIGYVQSENATAGFFQFYGLTPVSGRTYKIRAVR